jgi:hypothetical protein
VDPRGEEPTEAAKIGLIIISDVIMHELNPPLTAESTQQPVRALSWLEDLTNKHWRYDLFTYARSVSEVNRRSLGVRG